MRRRRKTSPDAATAPMGRFSEPFPPHGALAAEGAENLLGRPRLDPLVVLVREAVQNSWDARRDDSSQVSFAVHGRHLESDQRRQLRDRVFSDPPKVATRLRDVLTRDDILLLALTDTGTTGLGGPIRADHPPRRHEPSNFVDLLFNIGQPAERELGGGTYGFGRTISFVVSEARAVLVHSRTRAGRRLESRFIGAAFSDHFTQGNRRFTGRHWWGRPVEGSIEPVVGDEADAIARSLGLPSFGPDEPGTTICVVAPDLRGRTAEQALRFIAGALGWNFWPKQIGNGSEPPSMNFSVALDGARIDVPTPEVEPPLHAFTESLRAVRAAAEGRTSSTQSSNADGEPETEVHEITLPKTGQTIGWLGLTRCAALPRPRSDEGEDEEDERGPSAAFVGPAHHIALMRHPELVVEYLSTAELPSVSSEYVGVFKPVREVDRAFARAEPPTHDGWNANLVPETKLRRFVGVALRTVRELTTEYAQHRSSDAVVPTTRLDQALGVLFSRDEDGQQQVQTAPFVEIDRVSLIEGGAHRVSEIAFSVEHAQGTTGTRIDVTAHVATHDGWTLERGDGTAGPAGDRVEVLGFFEETRRAKHVHAKHQQTKHRKDGGGLVIRRGDPVRWRLRVKSLGDLSVGVDLEPSALGETGR